MNLPRNPIPNATRLMAALILLIAPSVSLAGEPFEGKWLTTVSCEPARDAHGSLMGSRPNMGYPGIGIARLLVIADSSCRDNRGRPGAEL